jgi:hypothetical protein
MQFNTFALIALLSVAATAQNYNIKLYEHRACLIGLGKTCTNVAKNTCCNDGGKTYKSGKAEHADGSKITDNLKLYAESDCSGLAIAQKTDGKCANADRQNVQGAMVFIVINARGQPEEALLPGQVEIREPDESFMEEGGFRYTLKRNSTEGEAYEMLDDFGDKVAHIKRFGTRSEVSDAE